MRRLRLARLPLLLLSATVALEVAAVVLSWGLEPRYDTLLYAVNAVTLAGAGGLVASRHPDNAIGWLLLVQAVMSGLAADFAQGWACAPPNTDGQQARPASGSASSAGCPAV